MHDGNAAYCETRKATYTISVTDSKVIIKPKSVVKNF